LCIEKCKEYQKWKEKTRTRYHAVVHEQVGSVLERVAVLFRHGHARVRSSHVGKDQPRIDFRRQPVEVVVVPRWRNGSEDAGLPLVFALGRRPIRRGGSVGIPSDAEAVAVEVAIAQVERQRGVAKALTGIVALLDDGARRVDAYVGDQKRRTDVNAQPAHWWRGALGELGWAIDEFWRGDETISAVSRRVRMKTSFNLSYAN
jgi:hypothetical protein